MAIRYVSRPRRRSGTLLAVLPGFIALGTGTAASPGFSGSLLASLPSFITIGAGSFAESGSGTGQFTATHYVTADASGSGNGTIGSPYTLAQACALAQPGWHVELAPGIYIGPNRNVRNVGSFCIANPGTAAQPIVFFARNYAALTASGLTILQHAGTTQGSGCPVLQANGYHHWYGVKINEDQAPTAPDTGPVVCYSSQGNRFSYMHVDRGTGAWPVVENNHAAFRFEGNGCRNNAVTDCLIENYSGIGWNGSEQGIQVYGPTDTLTGNYVGSLLIENNVFNNCQYAVTIKTISGRIIQGAIIVRKNMASPSNYGLPGDVQTGLVNFIDVGSSLGRNQVYQNIQVGGALMVRATRHSGSGNFNIDVINNTGISLVNAADDSGIFCSGGNGAGPDTGIRVHNNIKTGTAKFRTYRYDLGDSSLQSCDHNYGSGSTTWAEHPDITIPNNAHASLRTLAEWVAATDWDDFSSTANPLLVSSAWGNADVGKLQAGSPCRNAGVDLLNLNGGGTSGACHIGAYSSDGVLIGIRPLT